MDATEVNARRQHEMAGFFVDIGGQPADQAFQLLPEVFHLEENVPGGSGHLREPRE